MELIRDFKNLDKNDVGIAGGKGASLGEMTKAGIPVPPGFVVLSDAFERFLEETDINVEIDNLLHEVDHKVVHTVEEASEGIQKLILRAEMPKDIADEVKKYFKKLDAKYVAVRSSATSEDSADAAWAGQLDSFLNTTEETLLENVKKCWASLFTSRAIFYRFEKDLHMQKISVAVVVQKMINSEKSGIAFSVHPVTEDRNQLIIEAGFGLGEAIVSGQITPDSYVVEKDPRRILDVNVNTQNKALYRDEKKGSNIWKDLSEAEGSKRVLAEKQILDLSELILKIENHYGFPSDIEWAFEKGKFYIVQSRPITTLEEGEIMKKGEPIFIKAFTRDYSLAMLEVWYKGEAYDKKPYSGEKQPFLPYIIFIREDNTVKSYYDNRGIEWISNHLMQQIQKNQNFLKQVENNVKEKLKLIKPIYESEKTLSKKELLRFIRNFEIAYPWIEAMWMLCHMHDEKLIEYDIENILKIRKETEKLAGGTDSVTRKSLKKIFPKLKDYVHVLTLKEIRLEKFPSIKELKKRDNRFIFTENKLYVDANREFIEKKYNITLEKDEIKDKDKIEGTTVYKGKVKGKVRRVMGHKDISSIRKGEVLVSPMTMPDFVPAMKKASAIVTDEGGITSHAAIVSRELGKPAIIGTKIASRVLKDGDEVEVDAERGIVEVIKRK